MNGDDIAVLEAVDASGSGVRVAFYRHAERVAHRIGLVTSAEVQWILSSVEGDSHEAFPPSPPLQELAIEKLAGGRAAVLLLGMAGRNHWSVSAESQPSERLVRFDVACRTRAVDRTHLHSVYQMLAPWQPSARADALEVIGHQGSLRLIASSNADCLAMLSMKDGLLIVGPERLGGSATHRWRYAVTLPSDPDTRGVRP